VCLEVALCLRAILAPDLERDVLKVVTHL
jgi:hypothetical protein